MEDFEYVQEIRSFVNSSIAFRGKVSEYAKKCALYILKY